MNKRLVLNGFLLLIILGLLWFITQQSSKREEIDSLYDSAMGNEIHSIIIHYEKRENKQTIPAGIELKKIAGQWMMTKPTKISIDQRKIKHLLTLLSDSVEASYPIDGNDLSRFGLETERVSIRFNGVKIQFGSLNPISHQRYLQKGKRIYLVAETVYGLLIGGVSGFMPINTN
ncbi:MAG: DUF4340 domain-containing protein [Cocleimonas sp.]|nr:DUF4340 domain-containing protein [Cocleimonas sp.]